MSGGEGIAALQGVKRGLEGLRSRDGRSRTVQNVVVFAEEELVVISIKGVYHV